MNKSNEDFLLPREIKEFISTYKCPVCKSSLDSMEGYTLSVMEDSFYTGAWCSNNEEHYNNLVYWGDPRKPTLNVEDIRFTYSNKYYRLSKSLENGNIMNNINVWNLNSDPIQVFLREEAVLFSICGNIFNFRKFVKKAFVDKIHLLMTFR